MSFMTEEEKRIDPSLGYPLGYEKLCRHAAFRGSQITPYSKGPPQSYLPYKISVDEKVRAQEIEKFFPSVPDNERDDINTSKFKQELWNRLPHLEAAGFDPAKFRVDHYGNVLFWDADEASPLAWAVDHWFPRSRGGRTIPTNLRVIQRTANYRKNDKLECLVPYWELQAGISVEFFLTIFSSKLDLFRIRAKRLLFGEMDDPCKEHKFPPQYLTAKQHIGRSPAALAHRMLPPCPPQAPKNPSIGSKSSRGRQKWTKEEEEALLRGISKFGKGSWKRIQETEPSLRSKNPGQCKDKWVNMCKTGRSSGYKSGALNEELSGKEDEMEGSDKENLDYIFSSPIGENPQHILEEIYGLEAQIETKAEEVKSQETKLKELKGLLEALKRRRKSQLELSQKLTTAIDDATSRTKELQELAELDEAACADLEAELAAARLAHAKAEKEASEFLGRKEALQRSLSFSSVVSNKENSTEPMETEDLVPEEVNDSGVLHVPEIVPSSVEHEDQSTVEEVQKDMSVEETGTLIVEKTVTLESNESMPVEKDKVNPGQLKSTVVGQLQEEEEQVEEGLLSQANGIAPRGKSRVVTEALDKILHSFNFPEPSKGRRSSLAIVPASSPFPMSHLTSFEPTEEDWDFQGWVQPGADLDSWHVVPTPKGKAGEAEKGKVVLEVAIPESLGVENKKDVFSGPGAKLRAEKKSFGSRARAPKLPKLEIPLIPGRAVMGAIIPSGQSDAANKAIPALSPALPGSPVDHLVKESQQLTPKSTKANKVNRIPLSEVPLNNASPEKPLPACADVAMPLGKRTVLAEIPLSQLDQLVAARSSSLTGVDRVDPDLDLEISGEENKNPLETSVSERWTTPKAPPQQPAAPASPLPWPCPPPPSPLENFKLPGSEKKLSPGKISAQLILLGAEVEEEEKEASKKVPSPTNPMVPAQQSTLTPCPPPPSPIDCFFLPKKMGLSPREISAKLFQLEEANHEDAVQSVQQEDRAVPSSTPPPSSGKCPPPPPTSPMEILFLGQEENLSPRKVSDKLLSVGVQRQLALEQQELTSGVNLSAPPSTPVDKTLNFPLKEEKFLSPRQVTAQLALVDQEVSGKFPWGFSAPPPTPILSKFLEGDSAAPALPDVGTTEPVPAPKQLELTAEEPLIDLNVVPTVTSAPGSPAALLSCMGRQLANSDWSESDPMKLEAQWSTQEGPVKVNSTVPLKRGMEKGGKGGDSSPLDLNSTPSKTLNLGFLRARLTQTPPKRTQSSPVKSGQPKSSPVKGSPRRSLSPPRRTGGIRGESPLRARGNQGGDVGGFLEGSWQLPHQQPIHQYMSGMGNHYSGSQPYQSYRNVPHQQRGYSPSRGRPQNQQPMRSRQVYGEEIQFFPQDERRVHQNYPPNYPQNPPDIPHSQWESHSAPSVTSGWDSGSLGDSDFQSDPSELGLGLGPGFRARSGERRGGKGGNWGEDEEGEGFGMRLSLGPGSEHQSQLPPRVQGHRGGSSGPRKVPGSFRGASPSPGPVNRQQKDENFGGNKGKLRGKPKRLSLDNIQKLGRDKGGKKRGNLRNREGLVDSEDEEIEEMGEIEGESEGEETPELLLVAKANNSSGLRTQEESNLWDKKSALVLYDEKMAAVFNRGRNVSNNSKENPFSFYDAAVGPFGRKGNSS